MTEPVAFSRTVKPVCFPKDPSQSYEDKVVTATGWGRLLTGALPNKLMGVDVKVLSIEKCQESNPSVTEYVDFLKFESI